ncbi:hypothetical protein [Nioella sp.]|uniref:hypothetical protein n=1 Tax=Nioella sp. TaxID=1912091 RepID=UPI003518B900
MDFESLTGTVSAASEVSTATGQIAKGIISVTDLFQKSQAAADADIKLALSELTLHAANAQVANADLKLRLSALQQELLDAQAFKAELERYELWETPTRAVVLRLKSEKQEGELMHYLCPNCIETKRKTILQGDATYRMCPNCRTVYSFDPLKSNARRT